MVDASILLDPCKRDRPNYRVNSDYISLNENCRLPATVEIIVGNARFDVSRLCAILSEICVFGANGNY